MAEKNGARAKKRTRGELRRAALAALDLPLARRPTPFMYRLSLALVALLVVTLPVVYLALVAGVGWGVYRYAAQGAELFAEVRGGSLYVLGRFGPLVVGAVLFSFLLKPLLARPAQRSEPSSLDPDSEPFLFDFVTHLSRRLNAPMPRRIDVDLDVNASASFGGGLRSLVGSRPVLTLGLPLVSGLPLRDLTAVLAHEFGHLSQGVGMRSYYLVQAVNLWFARVVYQRDRWDVRLERWSKNGFWMVIVVLMVARAGVSLSRWVLLMLMKVSWAASSHMSRQMEFDADRNAVRLCGAGTFVHSMELLPQIAVATHWAGAVNDQAFAKGSLADDYPLLVREGLRRLDGDTRRRVVEESLETAVDMYATHPPAGQRISRAEELGSEGVFDVPGPASVLFQDYSVLCRKITARAYELGLGEQLASIRLLPAEQVHSAGKALEQAAERVNEYFLGVPLGPTTLALERLEPAPPERARRARERLENVRRELRVAVSELELEDEQKLEQRHFCALAAKELRTRRLLVRDELFANSSKQAASMAADTASAELDARRARRSSLAELVRNRLTLTFDLACLPEVRARIDDVDERFERGLRAARALAALPPVSDELFELKNRVLVVHALLAQLEGQQDLDAVDRLLGSQARALHSQLARIRAASGELPYPLEHARGEVALADYLVETLPADKRLFEPLWSAADRALSAWGTLMCALLGDVASFGLAAEMALQLTPLRAGAEPADPA